MSRKSVARYLTDLVLIVVCAATVMWGLGTLHDKVDSRVPNFGFTVCLTLLLMAGLVRSVVRLFDWEAR